MALTVSEATKVKFGNKKGTITDITFDSSYPTNGEDLTAAQLGLLKVDQVIVSGGQGYGIEYDITNSKLKAFASAGTEVTNATDLHTVTAKVLAIGI